MSRVALLILLVIPVHFSLALEVVTGDFPPYTGADIQGGGISSQIVRAAFKAAGYDDVKVSFTSWSRGFEKTKKSEVAGTFPYVWNADRDALFLYSAPINIEYLSYFVRADDKDAINGKWNDRIVCLPLGWNDTHLKDVKARFKLMIVQPKTPEQCLELVDRKRADLFSVNDRVARLANWRLFENPYHLVPSKLERQTDTLYFIVSRTYPDAQKLINDFNRGLAKIRAEGDYLRLVSEFDQQQEDSK